MSLIPPTRRPTKHIQLRCNTDHVPTIDLNADLGKVSARGISATTTPCRHRHERQSRLRIPRRQPSEIGNRLPKRIPTRREHRRTSRLPRPGRLRPPIHRRRPGRTDGGRDLPDRSATGTGAHSRVEGQLRETSWRPVQHDRHPSRTGARRSTGGVRRRSVAAGAGSRRVGAIRRGAAPGLRTVSRRSPTVPIHRTADWSHAR